MAATPTSPWSALRRRLAVALLVLLTLAPVVFIFARTEPARRNIVYWDEFDTALAMLVRLHENTTPGRMFGELFAINNEHRMVTSRALFAANYALTGSINFVFLNLAGNAALLGLCALLIVTARTGPRRLLLAALLAGLLFQLQHYENFLWSGASIDHFVVILLAAASIVCVARNTTSGIVAGALFAALATFTLAHGIVTWAVGAALLWRADQRRGLALWLGFAAVAAAAFLIGFQLNRSQGFASASGSGVLLVLRYWLTLLGAVPALGVMSLAPWLGAVLLVGIGWLARRDSLRTEPIAFALILFAVVSLALIAIGRAQHSGGVIFSRYYVLSGVAWSLVLFLAVQRITPPERPLRSLAWLVPALAVFNITANRAFSAATDSWIECRDRAVSAYLQYGEDGHGPLKLHPVPAHSTRLLAQAARAGLYRLPPLCREVPFPQAAKPSTRLAYFVDAMTVTPQSAFLTGWAALQGQKSHRHDVHLVLATAGERRVFTAVTETRPDVAKATQQPGWELSGFQFVRLRDQLPAGEYQVGFLIDGPEGPEFAMTAHRIDLTGAGRALLAN